MMDMEVSQDLKIRAILSSLDAGSTLIVPDVWSRDLIYESLLAQNVVVEKLSVLRASEFWLTLFKRLPVHVEVLPSSFERAYYAGCLQELSFMNYQSMGSVHNLQVLMRSLGSILLHPNGLEVVREWLSENPDLGVSWRPWIEITFQVAEMMKTHGLVHRSWLPLICCEHPKVGDVWNRPLIVDLAEAMTTLEEESFLRLGKKIQVTWFDSGAPKSSIENLDRVDVQRFRSQVDEAKYAVEKVKKWIGDGVRPEHIAIVAPDLESYWPCLEILFRYEGLQAAKSRMARLGSHSSATGLIASLRTAGRVWSYGELRLLNHTGGLSELELARRVRVVADSQDLKRVPGLREKVEKLTPADSGWLNRDEFLRWWFQRMPSELRDFDVNEILRILDEVPVQLKMKMEHWLTALADQLAMGEFEVRTGEQNGVQLLPLEMTHYFPFSHAVLLNLSEEGLKEDAPVLFKASDWQRMERDLGFKVPYSHSDLLTLRVRRLCGQVSNEVALLYPMVSFSGEPLTPSAVWEEVGADKERPCPPQTRFDEWQLQVKPLTSVDLDAHLHFDQFQFSPSSLEAYAKCPTVFFIERVLRVADLPACDLDLDALSRGTALHWLFEKVMRPLEQLKKWTESDLQALVQQCGIDLGLSEEASWSWRSSSLLMTLKTFLKSEIEWKTAHPGVETLRTEVSFHMPWQGFDQYVIRGRIDRVDQDAQGRYVVIDYKSSTSALRNLKSWLDGQELQLAIYVQALESGATELPTQDVVGACYLSAKDWSRNKGYFLPEAREHFLGGSNIRPVQREERDQIFSQIQKDVDRIVKSVEVGRFSPDPHDQQVCELCSWRKVCRAPHLR